MEFAEKDFCVAFFKKSVLALNADAFVSSLS